MARQRAKIATEHGDLWVLIDGTYAPIVDSGALFYSERLRADDYKAFSNAMYARLPYPAVTDDGRNAEAELNTHTRRIEFR